MAALSDYTSGTISLANGSVTVTGTGTLFEVTKFREGDTLQIQNLTAVIASVDSDTRLTLTEPWTGVDIVNGPYRARQLGDGTRVSTQAATVIQTLGNGVLTNLAELGVEEGKVPVGGPTGEYELADLVQDPNGSLAKLAALTLAARQILQTDETGVLKAIALAANKILNTDANGDILQSDITPFARTILDDDSGSAMFATMGASQLRAINSGYEILPNGLIRQWGRVMSLNTDGGATITYPLTFPNAAIHFKSQILTAWIGGAYAPVVYADWTWNNASRSIWCRQINTSGGTTTVTPLTTANVMWEAIGW